MRSWGGCVWLSRIWLFSAVLAWEDDDEGTQISMVRLSGERCFPVTACMLLVCLGCELLAAVWFGVCSLAGVPCPVTQYKPAHAVALYSHVPYIGAMWTYRNLASGFSACITTHQGPPKPEQNGEADDILHGAILRYLKTNKKQHRQTKNNTTMLLEAWMCHVRSRVRDEKLNLV